MSYGYFDLKNTEYIITNPQLPVKWINYLGTLEFGGLVDHTGGMLLCRGDPALNRILKYIPQLPSSSFNGSTIYLRIKDKNHNYKVFSPVYTPTLDKYNIYECHVGLGYTKFITEFYGISYEAVLFVPLKSNCVVHQIKISNSNNHEVDIDLIPVVEYSHPHAIQQFDNADWVPQTMQSKLYITEKGKKILLQYPYMNKSIKVNYLTSNWEISSFQTDRRKFLGKNGYGTWMNPQELQNPELENYEASRGDNIGAIMLKLGHLKPDQHKSLIVQYGQVDQIDTSLSLISKYNSESEVQKEFQKIKDFWTDYLAKVQIETPSKSMNQMLNLFNPYQCYTTYNWSRFLSLYQLGLGARGIGFRDTSQDVMGIMDRQPEDARKLIEKLLSVQLCDGSAMHQFFPLTMEGMRGESGSLEERYSFYGDDHLWIILSICDYLKETGDFSFLDKEIPYYDKNSEGHPLEQGKVLDHMIRALSFTKNHIGSNNLPLLGFADWNDTVNLRKGAESLFIANLYGTALKEIIELINHLNKESLVMKFKSDYNDMKKYFNTIAWDGEWFIRYLDFDGTPIGSHKNEKSQIFTNAQSWPIISGFAQKNQAAKALESVNKHLNTEKGIKLSTPGYDGFDPNIGGITTYPPGAKENGGIFLHANPWVMMAECILGNGDRAFKYYEQINPAGKNDKIDEFEVEPYVYPQNILANEHSQFGLGRNSWLTGTASWCYQTGIKYILGIKPNYSSLIVDPCIPKSWDEFSIIRKFRGTKYKIRVVNPDHINKGIKSIMIDGKSYESNNLPIFSSGEIHNIEVIMGNPDMREEK